MSVRLRLKYFKELPFFSCSNYQIIRECLSTSENLLEIFKNNEFASQMKKIIDAFTKDNYTCNYYNHSNLQNVVKAHSENSLKIIHINIRSFETNKFKLFYYLNTLKCKFDIIFLTETGKVNIEWAESIFKGYKFINEPPSSKIGGAGMLINTDSFETIEELTDERYCIKMKCTCSLCKVENKWVKLTNKGREFITGSVYRHPNGHIEHFIESSEHIFSHINDTSYYIMAGDFNIDLLQTNHDSTSRYINGFLEANFIPCINLPTRFCETTATLIDHIMVKVPRKMIQTKVSSGNMIANITDHLPNFTFINTNIVPNKNRPFVRLFTKRKIEKFVSEINNNPSPLALSDEIIIQLDVNESYKEFITNLKKLLDQYFPIVRLSRSKAKNKPFVTAGIRVSIRHRDKLYQNYLKNKSELNRQIWKKYSNKVRELLRKSEIMFYKDQLDEHSGNCQNLWKTFGKILNNKKSSSHVVNHIKINNKKISDSYQIAQEFNKYFCSIGEKLAENFENTSPNHLTYLRNKVESSFFFHKINENELEREINKLDNKKSSGFDDISVKFLKVCKPVIIKPLVQIFNKSVLTGEYPDELKIAKVIPLFKSGEKALMNNYRPISLLSIINKLFEKLIYKRLRKFLIKYNVLYNYQFGFRPGYSTDMALIEIVDNIKTAIDDNKFVCGIFLDLTKAFDTVNHKILLDKLNHYGIRGITNTFFKSYLSNRRQFVQVNGSKSEHLPITCGVPQGSVLGPLLFLLYINDIANLSPLGSIRLFADDTNIFIEHDNLEQLYNNAKTLIEYLFMWFKDNKLTVNSNKSSFTIFTTKHKRSNNDIPDILSVNNVNILMRSSTKYLGVFIDEDLNWKIHINQLTNGLRTLFPVFYNIRKYLTINQVKTLYYTMIYSKIKYGIVVYGTSNETFLKSVQIIQNQLLKVLTEKPYRYSTNQLHTELKLIKVEDIFKQEVLSFVFNFYTSKLPPVFNSYFTPFSNIHDIGTRNRNTSFVIPHHNSNFGSSSLKVKGACMWNALSNESKSIKTIKPFRKALKDTYLLSYS